MQCRLLVESATLACETIEGSKRHYDISTAESGNTTVAASGAAV